MRLSLLFLASGALAATLDHRSSLLVARQAALVSDISAVGDAVKAADTNINSGSFIKLADNLKSLISALDTGTKNAKASPVLDQTAALGLASPASDLVKVVEKALTDLSGKKSAIVAAGLGAAVYAGLSSAQDAASAYITALTSKIPPSLSSVASGIIKPAQDQLAKTVNEFKNTGGGSAPSSASSVAAPAEATPTESTPAADKPASMPTEADSAETSAPSAPAVYPSAGTSAPSTASSNTTSSAAPTTTPEAYTGTGAPAFAMGGPAALAAAAIVAIVAL